MQFFRIFCCRILNEEEIKQLTLEWEGRWIPGNSVPGYPDSIGILNADNYELQIDSENSIEKSNLLEETLIGVNKVIGRATQSIIETEVLGRGEVSPRFQQIVEQMIERFDGYLFNDTTFVPASLAERLPVQRVIQAADVYRDFM